MMIFFCLPNVVKFLCMWVFVLFIMCKCLYVCGQRRVQDFFHQGQITFLVGGRGRGGRKSDVNRELLWNLPWVIFSSMAKTYYLIFIRGRFRGGHTPPRALLFWFMRNICPLYPMAGHASVYGCLMERMRKF